VNDTSTGDDGHERPDDLPGPGVARAHAEPQPGSNPHHRWNLHGELDRPADHRAPRQPHDQRRLRRRVEIPTQLPDHDGHGDDEHRHLGHVHQGRSDVGEEEPPVAVQHAETPRRQHEDPDRRRDDPHQRHRELERVLTQAGGQDRGHGPGEGNHQQNQGADDGSQEPRDGPSDTARVVLPALREQPAVGRDDRRGEHTLAEKALQHVRDPIRGGVRIGRVPRPEEVPDRALAHQPRHPRQENPGAHQSRPTTPTAAPDRRPARRGHDWHESPRVDSGASADRPIRITPAGPSDPSAAWPAVVPPGRAAARPDGEGQAGVAAQQRQVAGVGMRIRRVDVLVLGRTTHQGPVGGTCHGPIIGGPHWKALRPR
jgi:hypothetical protein